MSPRAAAAQGVAKSAKAKATKQANEDERARKMKAAKASGPRGAQTKKMKRTS
ncbi:MAG TPA: hypothetical protein VGZ01_05455 [Trinickia sp.]|nr:hypothetical protein [Trinickia sp.]